MLNGALMRWFVDGMNVIGTRPDGWWRDRDAAMLGSCASSRTGPPPRARTSSSCSNGRRVRPSAPVVIEVATAPKPKADAADDEIVRRLAAEAQPGLVRVVTSDRWLADRSIAAGASVQGADGFRSLLEQF